MAAVAWLTPAQAQQTSNRQDFSAGAWIGFAQFADERFVRCLVGQELPGGRFIGFYRSADRLGIRLGDRGWALTPGASYPVELRVDGGTPRPFTAYVTSGSDPPTVDMAIGDPRAAIATLQSARTLSVVAASQTLQFPLNGSRAALEKMEACFERNTQPAAAARSANPFEAPRASAPAAGNSRNPFEANGVGRAAPGPSPPPTVADGSLRGYRVAQVSLDPDLLRRSLVDMGYAAAQVRVAPPRAGTDEDWAHFIYETPDGRGAFVEIDSRDASRQPAMIAGALLARVRSTCRGQVYTGAEGTSTIGRIDLRYGEIGCQAREHNTSLFYNIYDLGNVSILFVTAGIDRTREAAARLDAKIRRQWSSYASDLARR
jgi:hypothetical protein